MPSMRFSKQRCMACCFSGGWLFTMLFLRSEKYWGERGGHQKGWVSFQRTASSALGWGTPSRKCYSSTSALRGEKFVG